LTLTFKRQAVALVLEENFTVKEVTKQLDVHENTLYRWIQEVENFGLRAFPEKGSWDFITQNKIKQLEKENTCLQEELEALKKFQVFLKQKSGKISIYKRTSKFYFHSVFMPILTSIKSGLLCISTTSS
jgi:transposase